MPDAHSILIPAVQTPYVRPLNIIVVDDDSALRTILSTGLTRFGHRVRSAGNGAQLDALIDAAPADAIILEARLPGEQGHAIATRLRKSWRGGIIMTTASHTVEDRIQGFNSGADVCLTKPVNLRELAAALDSLARRLPIPAQPTWRLDTPGSTLHSPHGVSISLTAHECLLLAPLIEHVGENVVRTTLFQALGYPDDHHGDLRLETLVSRLRSKVRKLAPDAVLPLRGRSNLGYAFLAHGQEE